MSLTLFLSSSRECGRTIGDSSDDEVPAKLGGYLLWVPVVRIVVFGGPYCRSSIYGNYWRFQGSEYIVKPYSLGESK